MSVRDIFQTSLHFLFTKIMKRILGWKEYLFPLVCASGNTHVIKVNSIVAIMLSAKNKMIVSLIFKKISDACEKLNAMCA